LFDFYYLGDFEMRWRDIQFEKPTEADGDEFGEVLVCRNRGSKYTTAWDSISTNERHWAPLSELPDPPDPIPDPPEGWRFVQPGEAFDKRAMVWNECTKKWMTLPFPYFHEEYTYIVPIDPPAPPEPQYRPYNADELKQTIGKLVDGVAGYRAMITGACGDSVYCQGQRVPADQLLANHTWTDGGKCGVKVE